MLNFQTEHVLRLVLPNTLSTKPLQTIGNAHLALPSVKTVQMPRLAPLALLITSWTLVLLTRELNASRLALLATLMQLLALELVLPHVLSVKSQLMVELLVTALSVLLTHLLRLEVTLLSVLNAKLSELVIST